MRSRIWRYVRLYGHFLAFSFSKGFEFRFDFYMRIIMDLCYYAVAIAFYRVLFLHTPNLGGWNEHQAMVFVSAYLIVDAINMTVFTNNLWFMPQLINRGDLDYYLTRPVSSLFFVSLRDFAANSFVNLLCALGIFAWAVARLGEPVSFARTALFFGLVGCGAFIFFTINAMANLLVFWTHAPNGFGELVWTLGKFGERPDGIYRGFARKVLLLVLPFGVISSFPARILIDGFEWRIFLHVVGITALFFGLLVGVWRFGLRSYSSASS
ncbi:MAG: ABC-2 family transporter protein [Bdellovibrionales bacterium]|nr:ABC-2 family transporter protein [Bdellovibrionales bacterium]